jgi:putative ATPase
MIYAGEDPEFIARRIIICASEDVGLADPMALVIANAAASALAYVGLPEARIPLAQAVIYIACAPKSNAAYMGIDAALADIKNGNIGQVPLHLKDAHYPGGKVLGHGLDYKYPHNFQENYVPQQYFPNELQDKKYYNPTNNGKEKAIKDLLKKYFPEVID